METSGAKCVGIKVDPSDDTLAWIYFNWEDADDEADDVLFELPIDVKHIKEFEIGKYYSCTFKEIKSFQPTLIKT